MTEIGEANLLNDEMNERLENRQDEESTVLAEVENTAEEMTGNKVDETVAGEDVSGNDWWMEEDAFSLQDEKEENLPGRQEK